MASELVVGLVSLVLVVAPFVLLFWLLGRTARHTAEAGSSLFGGLGVLISVFGFFVLISTQLSFDDRHVNDPSASRWEAATGPLVVISLGVLVCVGAQILWAVQERNARDTEERSLSRP